MENPETRNLSLKFTRTRLSPGGRMVVLTASGRSQPAWVDDRQGHGIFTYYLLEGIDRAEEERRKVSAGGLERSLASSVEQAASTQHIGETLQTPEISGNPRIVPF